MVENKAEITVKLSDFDEVKAALNMGADAINRLNAIDAWLTETNHPDADKIRAIANGEEAA
jgi:hypothetical protein